MAIIEAKFGHLPSKKPRGKKILLVAAAALCDDKQRILLARRAQTASMPGLWELPGGKAETGETPSMTLIRELHEELGISLSDRHLYPLTIAHHAYPEFWLLMPVFVCHSWQGTPQALTHEALEWVEPTRLGDYPCPAADIPVFVALLKYIKALNGGEVAPLEPPDQNAQNPADRLWAAPGPETMHWQ